MIVQTWVDVLRQSFNDMLVGVISFIPNFLAAVIIFIIGWAIGSLVGRIVMEAIKALKVDQALKAAGVEEIVNRAGYQMSAGKFLGGLIKWFIVTVFLLFSLTLLNLTQVTFFLQTIILQFVPQVIVAVLVLLAAAVIAEVAQGVVAGAARAAGIRSAGFAGTVARWAIWIFAITIALSQLGIGTQYFQTLFLGIVVALSLAFGLAFGLGGQEAAARFLERTRADISDK